MKKIILVFVFIGGVISGGYLIDPILKDVKADNYLVDEEYSYIGHCEYEEDFLDRFLRSDLTTEQITLITTKYEELLLEYGITEEELHDDIEITHNIMEDMLEYVDELGIDYFESYHRGHMFR